MMPSGPRVRNRPDSRTALLGGLLAVSACGDPVDVEIALIRALEPDPFDGVAMLRVVAATPGGPRTLAFTRWDQGPQRLEERLPLTARRVWVEGLDASGRVVSAASSPPLDLVDAPEDRLPLLFARVGVLSVAPGVIEPREGWRAVALGEDGVLLLGGRSPSGATPEATWRVDPLGRIGPGPRLPGGRSGAAVANAGRRAVVWGGAEGGAPATRFVVLEAGGPPRWAENPIDPGGAPALVPSDARRVLVVNEVTAEVAEIDVVDVRGSRAGALDAAPRAGAVARWGPGRLVVVGGRGLPSAAVYDVGVAKFVAGPVGLESVRLGGAARTTSALSTVIVGGTDEDGRPARGARTLRWSVPPSDTGTVSTFVSDLAPGPARLWDAGGGTLLAAQSTGALTRIELLGRRAVFLTPLPSPFELASHPDGSLRGVSDEGALLVFQPGPGRHLPGLETGAGLVPRRPESWRLEGEGVIGTAARSSLPGSVEPTTWAVLGEGRFDDFRLELDVAPIGRGRPALLFDFDESGYHVLLLERSARIRASTGRPQLDCPGADVAALDEGSGPTRIRFERRGDEARLDVGADGSVELVCVVPPSAPGRIAIALLGGSARFSRLEWGGPL